MTYAVPSLDQIVKDAMARHRAELPGTDAFLWPNTEHVFLKAVGGVAYELYQYLEWIKRQRFATEADGDQVDAHAKVYGITRRPAVRAHGFVKLTGTPGTSVAVGRQFLRSDGIAFEVTDEATIEADGTCIAKVQAVEAGADGNTAPFTPLTSALFISGVTAVEADADGIGGGADVEGTEALRARLLFRMRYPPRGGAAHDYVWWALQVPGVTRVWVDPLAYGPGTVGVWFMSDGIGNGIPNPTLVDDVVAYIQTVRPVAARVIVKAPIAATIDVKVSGLGTVSTTLQQRIEAEVKDVFGRLVDVSMPNKRFTLTPTLLWQAVARVTGNSVHAIELPSADIELPVGAIPVLGTVCII